MLNAGSIKEISNSVIFVGGEDICMRIPLLKNLNSRGFNVSVIGSAKGDKFDDAQIPYWQYSLERFVGPIADIKTIKELRLILTDLKPKIVHTFDTKPSLYVPLALMKNSNVKIARTITGMGYLFSSSRLLPTLLRPFTEIFIDILHEMLMPLYFKILTINYILKNKNARQIQINASARFRY